MTEDDAREAYLLARIQKDGNGCWLWSGYTNKQGYGHAKYKQKMWLAHRLAYLHWYGNLPEGKELHHTCKNKRCINPQHLIPVTRAEHPDSIANVHAAKTHCKKGHVFDDNNTYYETRLGGKKRCCRQCNRLAAKRYQQRKREHAE